MKIQDVKTEELIEMYQKNQEFLDYLEKQEKENNKEK